MTIEFGRAMRASVPSGVMAQRGATGWRVGGVVVFAVAALLLASMGGAIVAAPATLPLLYAVVMRHPTRAFRIAAAIIGGLTAGELAWALTYLSLHERQPWIWLVPLVTVVAVGRVYVTARPREAPSSMAAPVSG